MTVDELIDLVVGRIYKEHYMHTSRKSFFHRDRVALEKCVARYGYECNQRGWNFEADAIWADIMRILDTLQTRTDDVQIWFPIYLESTIDRHIRIRAEELSAEAKKISSVVKRAMAPVQVSAVREPTTVEILSAVYLNQRRIQRHKRKVQAAPKSEQLGLL